MHSLNGARRSGRGRPEGSLAQFLPARPDLLKFLAFWLRHDFSPGFASSATGMASRDRSAAVPPAQHQSPPGCRGDAKLREPARQVPRGVTAVASWMWTDRQHRDSGLPVLIGAVVPEDPPRRGRVVLHVGVPYLHIAVDRETLVLVRVQATMPRVALKASEGSDDLLVLCLLVRIAVLEFLEQRGRRRREPQFVWHRA